MIAIIANPNALRFSSEKLKRIANQLGNVDIFFTQKAKNGTDIANKIAGSYEIIATYGGDGIINEVINADLNSSKLAIIPAGTTNVLAIELFGKASASKAIQAIKRGKAKTAYTGKINNTYFILMAGFGFDAESVHNVNPKLKRISGKFAYFSAGVVSYLKNLKRDCFEIEIENKRIEAVWAIVSKAKKYAGNYTISAKIDIFKPLFDVVICRCANRGLSLPYYNLAIFSGLHRFNTPFVEHIITEGPIKVKGNFKTQIDGDEFLTKSAEISIGKQIKLIT
ncbi:diacylglycerol/lipid kinase family protein [Hippea maritima]|uniref:Diacylglycerol kinase catalytic region n=1 Tax=Hippea maritima (strain ATCC 700847 / DSM 10411 / MH2) TaxID=760142 RepID=F2LX91_HIPMA|nr:diacylglycerol kinase family protein [Hippea maritima]AEA33149.1 diacylglycerol kinase catalytic region [Hippea maritima DSM 10411]